MSEVIKKYDLEACFFNMFGYQRFNYSHEDFGFSHDPTAVKAFALHPLVDSVNVARRLVEGYTAVHPGLYYLK